jgi:hypothetical protein
MKKPPTIPCQACDGTGKTILSEPLQETLKALKEKGPISAADLFRAGLDHSGSAKITVTALNNRLEELRHLNLASRARYGRSWLYTAK